VSWVEHRNNQRNQRCQSKFLAFERTAKFALRKAISTSPATSELRPEKVMSQSGYSVGTQCRTIRLAICGGIGAAASNVQRRSIFLSADFAEAPTATTSCSYHVRASRSYIERSSDIVNLFEELENIRINA
jgi:hypothetical protein